LSTVPFISSLLFFHRNMHKHIKIISLSLEIATLPKLAHNILPLNSAKRKIAVNKPGADSVADVSSSVAFQIANPPSKLLKIVSLDSIDLPLSKFA